MRDFNECCSLNPSYHEASQSVVSQNRAQQNLRTNRTILLGRAVTNAISHAGRAYDAGEKRITSSTTNHRFRELRIL